ncbi:MAG: hypothetical protein SP1CHLAM54_05600 [Chlamydiia bacterium]|nr:hypothetical protein [Chlamydiia bacterium]MCH9615470.1 hypothetical protein [Chlamydiia bacterium]MCH9629125.1 hypothetical protein [Chlamydiia bacterium]
MAAPTFAYRSRLGSFSGRTDDPGRYLRPADSDHKKAFVRAIFDNLAVKKIEFEVGSSEQTSLVQRSEPVTVVAEADITDLSRRVRDFPSTSPRITIELTNGKVIEFTKWFFSATLVTYEGRTDWVREDGTFGGGAGK